MTRLPRSQSLRDSAEWRVFEYLSKELGVARDSADAPPPTEPERTEGSTTIRPSAEMVTNPE